jgi:hypothetical protein
MAGFWAVTGRVPRLVRKGPLVAQPTLSPYGSFWHTPPMQVQVGTCEAPFSGRNGQHLLAVISTRRPWAHRPSRGMPASAAPARPPSPSPSQVRREARPRPSCPALASGFMPASRKCPPTASASPPTIAMPRKSGSEARSRTREPSKCVAVEAGHGFSCQWRKAARRGETWNVFRKPRRRLRLYHPRKAPELLYL